ncbi:hypothetical protein DL769_009196 [Monosporascus sp. CRB-8-3]|nr:hypothetical protein DL769_009196 [Monosporascus sp. CRB-8-3]
MKFEDIYAGPGATQVINVKVEASRIDPPASARPDFAGYYSHTSLHPVKAYVERPALCDRIRQQLDRGGSGPNQGTRLLAVWGLGGAGKTQLVLDYLCRFRTEYKAVFWIEAGQKESIERDFVYIYRLLFEVRTTAGQEGIKADDAVLGVKSWFSGRRDDRWVVVFDGADAIDDENDDKYVDLSRYIPESPLLDVIITTRSRTAKDMTSLDGVEVGEMQESQAVDLFCSLSTLKDQSQDTEDEIRRVVKELGCFALAVTLAGTYVSQTPRLLRNIRQYLPEYRDRRHNLLSWRPKKLIHQYSESILTTWETSFWAVERQCFEACRLLTLLAFLNYDDISLGLFMPDTEAGERESPDQAQYSGSWRSVISPSEMLDMYGIEECFRVLQTYSFVQWKEDQASYSMHKLVHAWGYERLRVEERREYVVASVQLLGEAISRCNWSGSDEELRTAARELPRAIFVKALTGLDEIDTHFTKVSQQLEDLVSALNERKEYEHLGHNLRHVRGPLDKSTLEFTILLSELYTKTRRYTNAMNVHSKTLVVLAEGDAGSYLSVAERLKIAVTHTELLKRAYQRNGESHRSPQYYYPIFDALDAQFSGEKRWAEHRLALEKWTPGFDDEKELVYSWERLESFE